jgi:hypothetical protein
MLHDDTIIVANAIGGDGIIALPKRSGCKTMVPIPALGSRDNAPKIDRRFSLLQRQNIRIAGAMANRLALFRCRIGVIPLRGARYRVKN